VLGARASLADQIADPAGPMAGLAPPDRARAQTLAATTLRHLGRIDAVLAGLVERPPPLPVRNLLRLLVAELNLAGAPAHAAVDSAVRLARERPKTRHLAGLVNAVGRRVASSGGALWHAAPEAEMPDWIAGPLRKAWGRMPSRGSAPRIWRSRCPPAADRQPPPPQPRPALHPAGLCGGRLVGPGRRRRPARETPATRPGERILDLCAAPGGKTLQLAAAGADVTALDISAPRLRASRRTSPAPASPPTLVTADALHWQPETPFDAILLDAPVPPPAPSAATPTCPSSRTAPNSPSLTTLQTQLIDRALTGSSPAAASSSPPARSCPRKARPRLLIAGEWRVRGHVVRLGEASIWDAALPDRRLEADRQVCHWLDDLAALGNRAARRRAQIWVLDWIAGQGRGSGPGWRPETAGRRVKRWVGHARMLTDGLDPAETDRFWRALAAQQRYLQRSWSRAEPGLPRMRALGGLVFAGLVLPGPGLDAAIADLGRTVAATVDAEGCIASRRPEDLAEILILLIWTARMLENAGRHAAPDHLAAIPRIVPVLRALRLGDGSFPRFHGGSGGDPDRLDQALAELRLGPQPKPKLAMGYARLTGGRLVAVMDGATPPQGGGHAGTLAFELSSGRHPIVVNTGPGAAFGAGWDRVCRWTVAHSTVEIDGRSSARIRTGDLAARALGPRLEEGPSLVSVRQAQDATGQWLLATHDGYVARLGLLHERRLFVDSRGREFRGEEIVYVTDARARELFDRRARRIGGPVSVTARFHLHPAVEAEHDAGRRIVELRLASGELWAFRPSDGMLELEESIHLDPTAAMPFQTRQIVLRADVVDYLGQLNWSFLRLSEPARPGPRPDPIP
jgi:uncharacterized heparinase superfamily protein